MSYFWLYVEFQIYAYFIVGLIMGYYLALSDPPNSRTSDTALVERLLAFVCGTVAWPMALAILYFVPNTRRTMIWETES